MKKLVFITASILMAVSCHVERQDEQADTRLLSPDRMETIYAYAAGSNPETKTYIDENLQVRWNAGDCITLFKRFSFNSQWRFTGEDGDVEGRFEKVPYSGRVSGADMDHIYAVYPYRADTKINRAGTTITMTLPEEQSYRERSFGPGANAAVAVTDAAESLEFKNVGGYLVLRLYGDDVSVSRITLQGNNHEKIAGKANISVGLETNPTVTMDETASEIISFVCEAPVLLGDSSENSTDFWLVLPPTTFIDGVTITVTDKLGGIFTQSISDRITVPNNTVVGISPVQVVPNYDVNVTFDDVNFKAYCVENFDTDGDGEVSITEALEVITIDVKTDNIKSLEGIMSFGNLQNLIATGSAGVCFSSSSVLFYGDMSLLQPLPTNPEPGTVIATGILSGVNVAHHNNLRSVTIRANSPMAFINLSDCPLLQNVTVEFCGISEINLSNDTALTELDCNCNQLSILDVSNNTALRYLWCDWNCLTTLDVSNNTALTKLDCVSNQLTTLYANSNPALTEINCSVNQLTTLNISNNTALTMLLCNSNKLFALDVSNNTALTELDCGSNHLATLDVSNNTALTTLTCYYNNLTTLDVSHSTSLTTLRCYNNHLSALDVSNNSTLTNLSCQFNELTTLDVSNNTALIYLTCFRNYLTALDVSNNTALAQLYCKHNQITALDVSNNSALTELDCDSNQLSTLDVSNNTALTVLDCGSNQLTALDVSNNPALTILLCFGNQLATLDVSSNTALTKLWCDANQLTVLDVSHNTALESLQCSYNQLTTLDVSDNTALTGLDCCHNQLTTLDVSHNTALTLLWCNDNQLTTLDVSNNTALTRLKCQNNQLTVLDVSHNTALTLLWCIGNPNLRELWLQTGQIIPDLWYDYNITRIYYRRPGNTRVR